MRLEHHPNGPRLYVHELRVHHGLSGLLLAALGAAIHERALVVIGAALVGHDLHDFPWPVRERLTAIA